MNKTSCAHCGEPCLTQIDRAGERFCCEGCATVYDLLQSLDMGSFYDMQKGDRASLRPQEATEIEAFDIEEVKSRFLLFEDEKSQKVSFELPQVHCSACIWLLENLDKLDNGVCDANVNLNTKRAEFLLRKEKVDIKGLYALLCKIGYRPDLTANKENPKPEKDRRLLLELGVAGFCFGNIMMLSFPEYLGSLGQDQGLQKLFQWLSIALAIPLFFFSGRSYLFSASKALKQRYINVDVPIAIGMIALLLRSVVDIVNGSGSGYLDSLAGFIFFLLLGKWFQHIVYQKRSYDRDYKAYLPISVMKKCAGIYELSALSKLEKGDHISIRASELIPADAILISDSASIDYSFITGESQAVQVKAGDKIFSGGKMASGKAEFLLTSTVDEGYLVRLWGQKAFKQKEEGLHKVVDSYIAYFTFTILFVALITGLFWAWKDPSMIWPTVTAVLIIACPCALALSIPFTYGTGMRIFSEQGLSIKDTTVIERMSAIDTLVFDKTGTLTRSGSEQIDYEGEDLSERTRKIFWSMATYSVHPLSIALAGAFRGERPMTFENLKEEHDQRLKAIHDGDEYRLGSPLWCGSNTPESNEIPSVHLSIDGKRVGAYLIHPVIREDVQRLISEVKNDYASHLLSGDKESAGNQFKDWGFSSLMMNSTPASKLQHIELLQKKGSKVLMIGDGLNDAGALKQADVGIAISDTLHGFVPSCDAIMDGQHLKDLKLYLTFSKAATQVVKWSFSLSFFYNGLGLLFATTGALSPIVAAILMPISSISTVLFVTSLTHWQGKKIFGNQGEKTVDMIQIMSSSDAEHSARKPEELALTS